MLSVWHSTPSDEVLARLHTSSLGLSEEDVTGRQKKHGLNILPTIRVVRWWEILLRQFGTLFVVILAVAASISLLLGLYLDSVIILIALGINAVIGFWQEYKAKRLFTSLKRLVAPQAVVTRSGRKQVIPKQEVTVGDIVLLEPGARAPADGRIIASAGLQTDESLLTGESMPVEKITDKVQPEASLADRKNMVYEGTAVAEGYGQIVVTAIGPETELGQISKVLEETAEPPTLLQKRLNHLARWIGGIIAGLAAVVFLVGVATGEDVGTLFTLAVALAVSAIPEGLVAVVTVALAFGMRRIARRKGLVKSLLGVESLGSTTTICVDKTGTLTTRKMTLDSVVSDAEEDKLDQKLSRLALKTLHYGLLCNDERGATEGAIIKAGREQGFNRSEEKKKNPRIGTIAFTPERKFMVTAHKKKGSILIAAKGAPEVILSYCRYRETTKGRVILRDSQRRAIRRQVEKLASEGKRILAVVYSTVPGKNKDTWQGEYLQKRNSVFLGLLIFTDPLRPEAKEMIRRVRGAGIRTIIVTGDYETTTLAIAREIGVAKDESEVMSGAELHKIDLDELTKKIGKINVFARVTPKDKLKIVKALQRRGESVAMTGDGVNDAPALKAATIGIAVASATDVAKEAADIVLMDNSFQAVIAAVQEGRGVMDNIKKIILYLLSDSFSEIIIILGSMFLRLPLPLLPAQILWINLVTDGLPDVALTKDPYDKNLLRRQPVSSNSPLLTPFLRTLILIISLVTGLGVLAIFIVYLKLGYTLEHARSVAFTVLGIDSLLYVFSCRTLKNPINLRSFVANQWLILAVVGGLIFQLVALYVPLISGYLGLTPLTLMDWAVVGAVCLVVMGVIEGVKRGFADSVMK